MNEKTYEEVIKRNKELVEKYPFLLIKIDWDGRILEDKEINYEYTWWDDIPEGWAKAFGEQMCDELLEILKEADYVDKYQIIQIKEKFSELRWYDCGVPKEISDKYYAWLTKYENLSYKTCIKCGKPATIHTKGWVIPLCDECNEMMYKK